MTDDIVMAMEKFEELAESAERAESRFEKMAVFAATRTLSDQFVAENEWRPGLFDVNPSFLEAVRQTRRHIYAAVGYEVAFGRDAEHHIDQARTLIREMKDVMLQCGYMPTKSTGIRHPKVTKSTRYFRGPKM